VSLCVFFGSNLIYLSSIVDFSFKSECFSVLHATFFVRQYNQRSDTKVMKMMIIIIIIFN